MPTLTSLAAANGWTAGNLNTDGWIAVVPAYQKIYFADGRAYSATIANSGYHKLDCINTSLVGAPSGAFTKGETMTQAVSGATGVFDETIGADTTAKNLVYRTSLVEFVTGQVVTGGTSTKTVSPTAVNAPPLWLNWILTTGTFPDGGSNIMALCGGRIHLNSMYNPHQWFCTRQGNPLDLNTAVDDEQAADSSQNSIAGIVGDAITTFIPFKDHYLIFGCAKSMWVRRGDSRQGGTTSNLTYDCGVFSPTSWCYDDKDNLYWVDLTGFYKLTKEALINGGAPENILINSVPNLFKTIQLNRRTDRVVCGYDRDRHGIVVSISMLDGAWQCAWFYDILYGSFLPDSYAGTTIPASILYANSYRGDYRALLVGGYDGYIRKFDEDTLDDDGTAMGSYVLLGPINLYQWVRGSGMIDEIEITLGEVTTNCVWSLFAKETAEDIYDAVIAGETPVATGVFSSGGIQTVIKQRISGKYIGLLLKNTTTAKTWETEGIKVHLKISGKDKE
jgi:hypothetical protein